MGDETAWDVWMSEDLGNGLMVSGRATETQPNVPTYLPTCHQLESLHISTYISEVSSYLHTYIYSIYIHTYLVSTT